MCFSKQAIEIVPNLKEKQTEIEKIILQQSLFVRKADGAAGKGSQSKRMPFCNGMDRA